MALIAGAVRVRICQAGDAVAQSGETRVDVLGFFETNTLRVGLVNALGTGQINKDEATF